MLEGENKPQGNASSSENEAVVYNIGSNLTSSQTATAELTPEPTPSVDKESASVEAPNLSEYEVIVSADGLETDPNVGTSLAVSLSQAATSLGNLSGEAASSFAEHYVEGSQGFEEATARNLAASKNWLTQKRSVRVDSIHQPTARQVNAARPVARILTTFTPLGTVQVLTAAIYGAVEVAKECYEDDIPAVSALSRTASSLGSATSCAVDALGNIIGAQSAAENRRRSSTSTVQASTTTITSLSSTAAGTSLSSSSVISSSSGAVVLHTENSYSQTHTAVTSSQALTKQDKAK